MKLLIALILCGLILSSCTVLASEKPALFYGNRTREERNAYYAELSVWNGAGERCTPKPSPTRTATITPSPTSTPTPTLTPTATSTPTSTPTPSPTLPCWAVTSTPTPTEAAPESTEPPPGKGKTYYVATDGSDSSTGSASHPWRTVQRAVEALKPGDTLYLRSGVYVQTNPLEISVSGSASAGRMITISTDPDASEPAVISGDTDGDGQGEVPERGSYSGLVQVQGSYIRLQNLEVSYSGGNTINSNGRHNIIAGNNVHHAYRTGIQVEAADNIVEDNTVWRSSESNYCGGNLGRICNGNWSAGIAWGLAHDANPPGAAPRTIVRGNTVYNNSGEGMICMHTDNALIDGNVVYDNWALQIDLDQCSYSTVQKNLVYATDNPSWWRRTTGPGTGIMLSNEGIAGDSGDTYPAGHDRKVINNIMVGNGANFYFWKAHLTGSALINDLIANNTLVEAIGDNPTGLKIDDGPHENTHIYNNLVLQSGGNAGFAGSTGGLTFGHNLWANKPPSDMRSASDVIGNPHLLNPDRKRMPGNVAADWYKLKDGTSPAIGRGLALPDVTLDFWNNLRSGAPDIGAHQYNR